MPHDLDLTTFKVLSFDCYGTLIDWETGIAGVLGPWARDSGLQLSDEELLLAYSDNEAAVEQQVPAPLYPDVLATAFRRTGERLGKPVDDLWARRLGESVPDWPAFPDSEDALARLRGHYELIILSNVHRAGFAAVTSACTVTSRRSSPPRTSVHTSPQRTTSVHSKRSSTNSASLGPSCFMSRRASSMTTCRPSARV